MKKYAIYILFIALSVTSQAATSDFNSLSSKASRFYNQKEWASALAMYQLMLEIKPESPEIYGKAIVAAAESRDSSEIIRLTEEALKYHIPFDSIFQRVRTETFSLGQTDLYEEYLLGIGREYSWMSRAIDGYLAEYYLFRRNGSEIIRYAGIMLDGMPVSEKYLLMLAQGYLLSGQIEDAMKTYLRVLEHYPDSYTAMLYLGNHYYDRFEKTGSEKDFIFARKYLSMADSVRSTPFVTTRLKALAL